MNILDVSKILRTQRNISDISLRELGKRCGISKTALHRYERGETVPRVYDFLDIMQLMGCKVIITVEQK